MLSQNLLLNDKIYAIITRVNCKREVYGMSEKDLKNVTCKKASKKSQKVLGESGVLARNLDSCKEVVAQKTVQQMVEEGLRKKFHKSVFAKFVAAINNYNLLKEGDKVAVCISGGKDSMLMAKLFQELKRHNKYPFELVFMVMDPGYSKANRKKIEQNAELLGVPVVIFDSPIFENVVTIEKLPCYICARMRRGYLYSKAKELGCNKIALGHHFDDAIETVLMGMLYGAQVQTMMPMLHSQNFEGIDLIRPMIYIRERDIIAWRDAYNLEFLACACKFTEENYSQNIEKETQSMRKWTKNLIKELEKHNKQIPDNIYASMSNINLSQVIGYKDKDGKRHSFLEDF